MTTLARIEARLAALLSADGIPEALRGAMEYSLLAGGKRLRPQLCMEACAMLGGSLDAAETPACALEMIHTYSLIHDDLPCMDDDDFRRGRPSNHKVYGEANALLAGDGLLSYAFEIMLEAGEKALPLAPRYYEAVAEIARGAGVRGMVAGQWDDLANEKNPTAGAETLTRIHARKTGALLTAAVVAGAIIGNADEAELMAVRTFGREYGLLFQITDDLLDVEGDAKTVGKTLGKDAAHEKLTYPRLYGVSRSHAMAREAAERAKAALAPFGGRAAWFSALAQQALTRTF